VSSSMRVDQRRRVRTLFFVGIFLFLPCLSSAASAISFNVAFDPSTASAPASFFSAFDYAVQFYQTNFSDPMVINIRVGWGDINGNPLNPDNVGQSMANQQAFPYDLLRAALVADAKTTTDAVAVASLPGSDPTPGKNFWMSNGEAKALGLLAGNALGLDGSIGFNKTAAYTFDPENRAVAGAYDFIAAAEHEITEIMGRYGFGQNGSGGRNSPIDLFRYTAPGVRYFAPIYGGTANYFSIDGGVTPINTFNTICCGDVSDWSGDSFDAYNAFVTRGRALLTSSGDLVEMDALGYDRVAAVPEPDNLWLMAAGLLLFLARRKRLREMRTRSK
jgi:hypothetical protein